MWPNISRLLLKCYNLVYFYSLIAYKVQKSDIMFACP